MALPLTIRHCGVGRCNMYTMPSNKHHTSDFKVKSSEPAIEEAVTVPPEATGTGEGLLQHNWCSGEAKACRGQLAVYLYVILPLTVKSPLEPLVPFHFLSQLLCACRQFFVRVATGRVEVEAPLLESAGRSFGRVASNQFMVRGINL